jgi:hypothetical protein
MTTVNFKGFDHKIAQAAGLAQAVMPQAFQYFESLTPVRSGNARNSTRLNHNKIEAQYQYASVLDAGRGYRSGQMRGSVQAPNGMSAPTRVYLNKLIHDYFQNLGK